MQSTWILSIVTLAASGLPAQSYAKSPSSQEDNVQYIHRYGISIPKHHWEECGQNGQVIKSLNGGIVCSQTFYFGLLHGETSYTFPYTDNIEKLDLFSNGHRTKETWFYFSGNPRKEIIYQPEQQREITEWYENGSIKSSEKWTDSILVQGEYFDASHQRISSVENGEGVRTNNDAYGYLSTTDHFKNGKLIYQTTYHPNASPKEVIPYKDGFVDGLRRTYYPGGEPMAIETWQQGRQHGITTFFHNGEKTQEVSYIDGMKNGKGYVYQDGSVIIQEQLWKDDLLHGCCITYVEGEPSAKWYYKGKTVSKGYYDSFNKTPERMVRSSL